MEPPARSDRRGGAGQHRRFQPWRWPRVIQPSICSNQVNVGIAGSGRWSWRTPCAGRSAFQMKSALSRRLLDFPDRERLGTTVNERFSFLPLHSSRLRRFAHRESNIAVASTPSGIPRTYERVTRVSHQRQDSRRHTHHEMRARVGRPSPWRT